VAPQRHRLRRPFHPGRWASKKVKVGRQKDSKSMPVQCLPFAIVALVTNNFRKSQNLLVTTSTKVKSNQNAEQVQKIFFIHGQFC